MDINVLRLGRIDYGQALAIQEKLFSLRQQEMIGDCLLLLEHDPVLTIGRSGKENNIIVPNEFLESKGVSVYEVSRGGDVTYHGPGQIVGYPIMDLMLRGKDLKDFVVKIEEIFIRLLLNEYSIIAHREEKKYTGVWVDDAKITAIGIAVRRWVTMHGFAFNVNTDLTHFQWINPCGITDRGVTSLEKITGHKQDFEVVNLMVLKYFCEVFDVIPKLTDINELTRE